MTRFSAFFLAAAPLTLAAAAAAPAAAQAQTGLAQVQAHLRAVQTMTATFTQTDARGRSLAGTVTIKRPGRIRFDYGRAANMLVVADGRTLTFLDYSVGQQQRWPIGDSPLSVFLNPNQDLARFARVIQDDPRTLLIQARDPRRREFGTITIRFSKAAGAPGGLILQGWNTVDAQNNRTNISLSGQRFNVPVADSAFNYRPVQRRGPRR